MKSMIPLESTPNSLFVRNDGLEEPFCKA